VIRGLEPLYCEERLGELGLFSLGKSRVRLTPYSSLPVPEEAYEEAGEGLFTRACRDMRRGNGFKLKKGRFRPHIRKKFFTMRVVKHWHMLPREVADAPSLEAFKVRLDGALSNLIWLKMTLLVAGRLD